MTEFVSVFAIITHIVIHIVIHIIALRDCPDNPFEHVFKKQTLGDACGLSRVILLSFFFVAFHCGFAVRVRKTS